MAIGTNITASSFKDLVSNWVNETGENVWQKKYYENINPLTVEVNKANAAFDAQLRDIKTDYTDIVNQAYAANAANKRAVEFSNYGTGDKSVINQAYTKAFEEARKQYRIDYESTVNKIEEERQNLNINYADTVKQFVNAVNTEQESIAQNYADFFNSYYDYLTNLYEQYGTDEYIFGTTSPLSNYVVYENGVPVGLKSMSDVYNSMMSESNGEYYLNTNALDYITTLSGLDSYLKSLEAEKDEKVYTDLPSFQEYLYKNAPELEKFRTEYGEQFYKDIGFADTTDVYKTADVMSKYSPENTYFMNLGTDAVSYELIGNDVNVKLGDYQFELDHEDDPVSDALKGALNTKSTGKRDTTPEQDTVVIYGGNAYIFDDSNDWYKLDSDEDDVADFIQRYKEIATGDSPISYLGTSISYDEDKHGETSWTPGDDIMINNATYKTIRVPSDVEKVLKQRVSKNSVNKIVEYNGKYYVNSKYKSHRGATYTKWIELVNYKPSK